MKPAKFKDELRPLVASVGGVVAASKLCGVTRQTMHAWLAGRREPNAATRAGVEMLLGFAAAFAGVGRKPDAMNLKRG